jgi:predicted SAM-dependent methyltransferase
MTRLHFGCFNCPQDGWLNTDVTPQIYVARVPGLAWLLHKAGKMNEERFQSHQRGLFRKVKYLDVTKAWPYANETFEAIFSSHIVEHLTLDGAKNCMSESYRCLKNGGVLRISVPDLDALILAFSPKNSLEWTIDLFEANQKSEKNMHHFMYNFDSLYSILRQAGFSQITRQDYRQGICPDIDKLDNRPGSLFVEAIK